MPATKLPPRKRKSKIIAKASQRDLTKRMTLRAAHSAGRNAALNAMEIMGYIVVAEGDNVVKKYADGTIEIIGTVVQ